jgi:hypothetical protein
MGDSPTLRIDCVTLVTHIYQVVHSSSIKVKFNLNFTASSSSNLAQHTKESIFPNLGYITGFRCGVGYRMSKDSPLNSITDAKDPCRLSSGVFPDRSSIGVFFL